MNETIFNRIDSAPRRAIVGFLATLLGAFGLGSAATAHHSCNAFKGSSCSVVDRINGICCLGGTNQTCTNIQRLHSTVNGYWYKSDDATSCTPLGTGCTPDFANCC